MSIIKKHMKNWKKLFAWFWVQAIAWWKMDDELLFLDVLRWFKTIVFTPIAFFAHVAPTIATQPISAVTSVLYSSLDTNIYTPTPQVTFPNPQFPLSTISAALFTIYIYMRVHAHHTLLFPPLEFII